MKNWNWKNWTMFGVFVALFVTAGILVVVGVTTHTEAGFAVSENSWDHIPLTVGCANYSDTIEGCPTVQGAVVGINGRLGFTMLLWVGLDAEGVSDIVVTLDAPVEVGESGPCSQPGECFGLIGSGTTYTHCTIQTMNVSGELRWLVVGHGLGHCMGLAHDDYGASIMYPVQRSTPSGGFPSRISDWDRNRLRERYRVE